MLVEHREIHLEGTPLSPGVAMGYLYFNGMTEEVTTEWAIALEDIDKELIRYREALAQGREDLTKLIANVDGEPQCEGSAILNAHLQLLRDPAITCDIEHEIRRTRKNAEFVLQQTINKYQKKFNSISNPFFRERFYDLQAVIKRILDCLKGKKKHPSNGERGIVVYTRELSFIELTEAAVGAVKGFITESSSSASHSSIIANARGIPFVTSISSAMIEQASSLHAIVIVDGNTGDVYIHPSNITLDRYLEASSKEPWQKNILALNDATHAETYDGYRVQLSANIEMAAETKLLHEYGGNGVGLFRSECAFLSHANFPSEDEQYLLYKEAIESMKGMPFVIRVFDLGGDKYMLGQKIAFENNPFLGCRAIRFLLREKELFKIQLKAILRASIYGNIGIMFPMVSSLAELLQAKALLAEARKEVEETYGPAGPIRIGCMIEVPSAALMADVLAKECDFLSIGTNDLVQYVLAVDRSNYALSSLYTPFDPSVIRLIKLVVSEANHCGIPVSICGEIAANPKFTSLLLGLGVHELSVSLRYMGEVKEAIRKISIVKSVKLAEKALSMTSAEEIEALIEKLE